MLLRTRAFIVASLVAFASGSLARAAVYTNSWETPVTSGVTVNPIDGSGSEFTFHSDRPNDSSNNTYGVLKPSAVAGFPTPTNGNQIGFINQQSIADGNYVIITHDLPDLVFKDDFSIDIALTSSEVSIPQTVSVGFTYTRGALNKTYGVSTYANTDFTGNVWKSVTGSVTLSQILADDPTPAGGTLSFFIKDQSPNTNSTAQVVFDSLSITEQVPEPASIGICFAGLVLGLRRSRRVSH